MKLFFKKIITVSFLGIILFTKSASAEAVPAKVVGVVPQFSHVVVVMLENHSYNQVVGSKTMPYYNALIKKYGLAQNYFANAHPSIGNYFMLTTGKIITNDDNFTGTTTEDNIAREITAAGKSWKVYAEGLPSTGYVGGSTKLYMKRHNPFAYFGDVRSSLSEKNNIVPFTIFSKDVSDNKLPNFSFIVPDACNDAHDCKLVTTDNWLKKNIDPLINDSNFKNGGLLAIVFDEGRAGDKLHGGGQDPVVLVGANVKSGFKSKVFYQHQNLLKTILVGLGINKFPGATLVAKPMFDFFK